MKAFIGHSFDERDEALINKICAFLTQRDVHWETGLKAQNKSVSDKVKERIDRNDFFIGIFTINAPIGKRISLFDRLKGKTKTLDFTTSNWVIQESGYAIGKDRGIILLVEKGIYKFPELQGDIEYIPFSKDKAGLNEALLRLGDMIQDIIAGKPKISQGVLSGPKHMEEDDKDTEKKETDTKTKKHIPYGEMFDAHEKGDIKKAKEVYNEKIRKHLEEKGTELWDAVIKRWEYCAGDVSALKELEKIAEDKKSRETLWQVGICYEFADKYNIAAEKFTKCLELAQNDFDAVDAIVRIAQCYMHEKKFELAIDNLIAATNEASFRDYYEKIYRTLISIAKDMEDDYLFTMFSEKALDINPVNTKIRFNLAYKYGKIDKTDLAIYHYRKLLRVS